MHDLMPASSPGSYTVDIGDGNTARVTDGRIAHYSVRDPWRETERTAYKRAEILHRNKLARSSYYRMLVATAFSNSDKIPASVFDDVRVVRQAIERDRARRAAVDVAVDLLRQRLADGLTIAPAPSLLVSLLSDAA